MSKNHKDKVYAVVKNAMKHTYPQSSSMNILTELLSGKYDDKLMLVHNETNKDNVVKAHKLENGIWNISLYVDVEKHKGVPTDQIKRVDWVYRNMSHINICLE